MFLYQKEPSIEKLSKQVEDENDVSNSDKAEVRFNLDFENFSFCDKSSTTITEMEESRQ